MLEDLRKVGWSPELKNMSVMSRTGYDVPAKYVPYYVIFNGEGKLIHHNMGGPFHGGDGLVKYQELSEAAVKSLETGADPAPPIKKIEAAPVKKKPAHVPFDLVFECEGMTDEQIAEAKIIEKRIEQLVPAYSHGTDKDGKQVVQQLKIDLSIRKIDGKGGAKGASKVVDFKLAKARILPASGFVWIDSEDLDPEQDLQLMGLIVHETFHVMGFGQMWGKNALPIRDKKGNYVGDGVLEAYRAEFGQKDAEFVPVEFDGGSGTAFTHWDEVEGGEGDTKLKSLISGKDLRHEIMTGWMTGDAFISNMTLKALEDLGYKTRQFEIGTKPYEKGGLGISPHLADWKNEKSSPEKPVMCLIEGGGLEKPSYVLGTLQSSYPALLKLHSEVEKAFESADKFYTESNKNPAAQLQEMLRYVRTDKKSLSEALGEENARRLKKQVEEVNPGANLQTLQAFKTWVAALGMVDLVAPKRKDLNPGQKMLDDLLWAQASQKGIGVASLRSSNAESAFFEKLSEEEQVTFLFAALEGAIAKGSDSRSKTEEVKIKAYLEGDVETLKKKGLFDPSDYEEGRGREIAKEFYGAMTEGRSAQLSKVVTSQLKAEPKKTHFFALDVGLIAGEKNLLDQLREHGFTVTPLW